MKERAIRSIGGDFRGPFVNLEPGQERRTLAGEQMISPSINDYIQSLHLDDPLRILMHQQTLSCIIQRLDLEVLPMRQARDCGFAKDQMEHLLSSLLKGGAKGHCKFV